MANIAMRADGRWRARYRDSAGKEHSRHFKRRVDAQHWLDEVTTAATTGLYSIRAALAPPLASGHDGGSRRRST